MSEDAVVYTPTSLACPAQWSLEVRLARPQGERTAPGWAVQPQPYWRVDLRTPQAMCAVEGGGNQALPDVLRIVQREVAARPEFGETWRAIAAMFVALAQEEHHA